MFRRLNFLLPNAELAQNVARELLKNDIEGDNIHTYSKQPLLMNQLNPATENQIHNKAQKIEDFFWTGNLILFFVFLNICILAIISSHYLLALICLGIMILSFTIGYFFSRHIPHTHINNFKHALSHNELLMMVDLPNEKVGFIEKIVHQHHPAVIEGGSSWTLKGVDI